MIYLRTVLLSIILKNRLSLHIKISDTTMTKKMTQKEYKETFDEDDAVGWDALNSKLIEVYGKMEPRHYAPPLSMMLGGKDPIEGTSIYDSNKQEFHRHLVSFGMSELYYNEEAAGGEFSKWGFELTFRLKPFKEDEKDEDPFWVIEVMNNLARYVYESKQWFEVYDFIAANGPIRTETEATIDIVGLIFVPDPELGKLETPNGEVQFLQMVGITSKELERLEANPIRGEVKKLADELAVNNPLLITDLLRK